MSRKNTRSVYWRTVWFLGVVCLFTSTAGSFSAHAAVPVPAAKPLIPVTVPSPGQKPNFGVPGTAQLLQFETAPLPGQKPNFGIPGTAQLLQFGSAPLPGNKPMPVGVVPISPENAALYKKIFSYQTAGEWDHADDLMVRLDDFRLRGHVLYQRYMHPTAYRSSFDELVGWLDLYADHPGARKIYNLAMARMPETFKGHVTRPDNKRSRINVKLDVLYDKEKQYIPTKRRTKAQEQSVKALRRAIRKDIGRGAPTRAYKRLLEDERAKWLDITEYDRLRAQVANSYMFVGKLNRALELAQDSTRRSGINVPLAGWVGGLVAWHQKKYRLAGSLFEFCATSPYASPWMASAGSYWASRAHTRTGHARIARKWLQHAAYHPRTFYGLIAIKALGGNYDFDWSMPSFTPEHRATLSSTQAGFRAIALVSAGQYHLAESELRQIRSEDNKSLQETLISYANYAGLPAFSMQLASAFPHPDGGYYDSALYPLAPWQPESGFRLDRALIHALIRQESKFNPLAESGSGATGLMQLMPSTASYVAKSRQYRTRDGRHKLKDPQINLDIGQRYVENLLYQEAINQDLLSLAVAYNAGPGNLRRWKESMSHIKDPLLFIESIPMAETRAFVERVMANYWIYRIRMGQDTPSLAALTRGEWARYVQMDGIQKAEVITVPAPAPALKPYNTASNQYN